MPSTKMATTSHVGLISPTGALVRLGPPGSFLTPRPAQAGVDLAAP